MKYVDTCVFVDAVLGGEDAKKVLCLEDTMTSVLTWDELVWSIRKKHSQAVAVAASEKFLQIPMMIVPTTSHALRRAHDYFRDGLGSRDSLHVAIMLEHGVDTIISDDPDFDKVKNIKRVPIKEAVK